ncbi:MAG: hypothetical protein WBZ23_02380 [Pseudolabrys sp.]
MGSVTSPRPDVLVADDGQTVAIRGPDGRLSVLRSSRDTFAVKEWLAAGADARTPKDAILNTGVTCDAIGCIGRLADGRLASMALEVEAFAEDCARAAVVVSARGAPSSSCAATLVDRGVWRKHGAIASGAANTSSKASHFPSGYQRPWTRVMVSAVAVGQGANQPAPRDASPRSEFLEADD